MHVFLVKKNKKKSHNCALSQRSYARLQIPETVTFKNSASVRSGAFIKRTYLFQTGA